MIREDEFHYKAADRSIQVSVTNIHDLCSAHLAFVNLQFDKLLCD